MHTVMLTINVNEGTSKQDILQQIEASGSENKGIAGLIRTYFGITADCKSVVEIYLWQSKLDAEKFFTHEWDASVSRRWQSAPMRWQDFETPLVVDGK
ncbi:MAG: hypothetical protein D4R58_01090 [Betaproteobacteria bacterium]|nr:MAG: hypothetical protein D4R58_01090 [Betaproteobacteria bacterium]